MWKMVLPNGKIKEVTADIHSSHCEGSGILEPYFTPPPGGKTKDVIGAELLALFNEYSQTGTAESNDIFQVKDGTEVLVKCLAITGEFNNLLNLLRSPELGLANEQTDPEQGIIIGYIHISGLKFLNEYDDLLSAAQPVYPALGNNSGLGINLGDFSMRSDFARGGYHVGGTGVKIGVISNSYNTQATAHIDVQNGDLPGEGNIYDRLTPVEVLRDYSVSYGSLSDEGRAMLQIVHDIAPDAALAFRTGSVNNIDFAAGIQELADAGCDIIVDDLTYITEPFFRDGAVARAVNAVSQQGVTYFSSAGNFGNKSYEGLFIPEKVPGGIIAHNFGGGDTYQSISFGDGTYVIVLQWDDNSSADQSVTSTDLDFFLTGNDGTTLMGFNRINTGSAPIEILPFRVSGGGVSTNIMISKASGPDVVNFKYIVFKGNDVVFNEYNEGGASTIVGQANAEGAIAVGAVLYSNTPEYGVAPPTIASFSSIGGGSVNGEIRIKPDITAPNGVETTVKMSDYDTDGDGIFNFHGTSAAAPHAAAVAALVKEAKLKYDFVSLEPSGIRNLLRTTAIDMYDEGFDYQSGYGFIQADAAILTFANPLPEIREIHLPENIIPGEVEFSATISGNYFTGTSVVMLREIELPTSFVNDSTLQAQIP
ncbi:MAG: S8 family serine peptidase, partial [Bacteroidales bacterium]|nr:S8 family serine peptidase [Bacteroidales bacterium]